MRFYFANQWLAIFAMRFYPFLSVFKRFIRSVGVLSVL